MNFIILNSAKQWGGNENWIALAAASLSELKHTVVIAYRSQQVGMHFPGIKIKLPFYSEVDIITIYRLIKLIKRYQIDIVIATKQKEYFIGGVLKRLCHVPNILRLGIVRPLDNAWSKKLLYHKWNDGIIVNARAIKETLLQSSFIHPDRIGMIYNGVDTTAIEKKSEQFEYKKPFSFLIVTSGMLIKRKGFDILLRAFAVFKQSIGHNDTGLLIVGTGEEQQHLQRLSRDLGIDKYTIFTGYQPNPFPYLKKGDCFVLMSENEGISNALLEAMALKLPVISALSGGITEVINDGENGFIINRNDEKTLVNRMHQLQRDFNQRQIMGEKAFQTIQNQFSLDRMGGEIIEFCSEILSDRKK
jgi:glycosyltransferase involved in cell wall biosynthesis